MGQQLGSKLDAMKQSWWEATLVYEFDVFLSYPHRFIGQWVLNTFLPIFEWHLESSLGRRPKIFTDASEINTGDSWPLTLQRALVSSRCLLPIWSPSYFSSDWCVRECMVMLQRERACGYRTLSNPHGLVLPVKVADGHSFPDYARDIQYFDCSHYARIGEAFKQTVRFIEFQDSMEAWAAQVANAIKSAPDWREEWMSNLVVSIPEREEPDFALPTMS